MPASLSRYNNNQAHCNMHTTILPRCRPSEKMSPEKVFILVGQNDSGIFFKLPEPTAPEKIPDLVGCRDVTLRIGEAETGKEMLIFPGPVFERNIMKFLFSGGLIQPVKSDKMFLTHCVGFFCERTKN